MQDMKGKFFSLSILIFLVIVVLFSNLGHDFKNDIFSYSNTLKNSSSLNNFWNQSEKYEDYIDSSSNYIAKILKNNDLKPLIDNNYIQEWNTYMPSFNGSSTLEILSKYGKVVKKYEYGQDFFEDFKGIINPGEAWGKPAFLDNIDYTSQKLPRILLFNGYKSKSSDEIINIDTNLLSKGVSIVISPAKSTYLKYDSGLFESSFEKYDSGLSKLIVTPAVFEELKNYSKEGYNLRIKSAGLIESTRLKNIYGTFQGKNKAYRPLVIAAFYDGMHKTADANGSEFEKFSITSSIITDCIRALSLQRSLEPDRTIIFAFLSGYSQGKEGLIKLMGKNISADYMIFDGLGTGDKNILVFNHSAKYFASTIENMMKKNDLEVLSKSISTDKSNNVVFINTINLDINNSPVYSSVNKSGKFLLSIIGDECYGLDFLSGNIREFRMFKRFVRKNTLIISSLTFIFLLVTIFWRIPGKRN